MQLIKRQLRLFVCIPLLLTGISGVLSCLTYDINEGTLILKCRVENTNQSSKIVDNRNNTLADFDFDENICRGSDPGIVCLTNSSLKEATLSVANFNATKMAGVWICMTGNYQYSTNLSDIKGVANMTDVSIYGVYNDQMSVNITCSSCTTPYTSSAEFLIDHRSVDTITYNKNKHVCFNKDNSCSIGEVCSCHPIQNGFSRVFVINITQTKYVFSCYMKFKGGDDDNGIIYGKTPSITLKDKVFQGEESTTIILNQWSKHGPPSSTKPASSTSAYNEVTKNTTLSYAWTIALVTVFPVFISTLIVYCYRRKTGLKQTLVKYMNNEEEAQTVNITLAETEDATKRKRQANIKGLVQQTPPSPCKNQVV